MSLPVSAQNIPVQETVAQAPGALIRNITIEGFVLEENRSEFVNYSNLTATNIYLQQISIRSLKPFRRCMNRQDIRD